MGGVVGQHAMKAGRAELLLGALDGMRIRLLDSKNNGRFEEGIVRGSELEIDKFSKRGQSMRIEQSLVDSGCIFVVGEGGLAKQLVGPFADALVKVLSASDSHLRLPGEVVRSLARLKVEALRAI